MNTDVKSLRNKQQQAIIARDMIQMTRQYRDDADVLEYLESLAYSVARGLEDDEVVSWDDLAGVCDQRYYSLKQGEPVDLNDNLLAQNEVRLHKYIPRS